jgi:hypothetical protein
VFLIGARGIEWDVGGFGCIAYNAILEHIGFYLLAADIGEHLAIYEDAGRERLPAQLLHLKAIVRVLNDVLLGVGEVIFFKNRAYATAPTTMGF